jgi:hypothetical protein
MDAGIAPPRRIPHGASRRKFLGSSRGSYSDPASGRDKGAVGDRRLLHPRGVPDARVNGRAALAYRPMQARDQQRRCVSLIDAKQASRRELGEFTRVANAELRGPRLRSILGLKPLAAVDGPERSCPNSAPRPTRCGLQLSTHAHALDTSVSRTVGQPLKCGTYTPLYSRRDRCRRGPSRSKKIARERNDLPDTVPLAPRPRSSATSCLALGRSTGC